MAMRRLGSAVRFIATRRAGGAARLPALALLTSLLPAMAAAGQETAACQAELAALDRSFVQTMARLLSSGTTAEQCVALKDQIDAVAKAVEVQMRCRAPGPEVDRFIRTLGASATDFRQLQAQLGCNVPA
jgi:hypothetical protein